MLSDQKILITGPAGQIAQPMAEYLARDNEVWGIARFSGADSRERVEALGVTTRAVDLASGDFGDLPDDFDYLVHMAAYMAPGEDYDQALRVNAEGTGLLLQHCRKARAALVASTFSVYEPKSDPTHAYVETDVLGDSIAAHARTYSISKLGQEAVARTMARLLELPTTIARINCTYGPNGGLPAYHLDWMLAGQPIQMRGPGPIYYSPIHQDDMNAQVEPLLAAASVPATIVNWAGDKAVTAEEWIAYLGELRGVEPRIEYLPNPSQSCGVVSENTRRLSITGPCRVEWRDGFRQMADVRHPADGSSGTATAGADRLRSAMSEEGG